MKRVSQFCIVTIIISICLSACSSDDYKAAELSYNNGDFEAASKIYETLGDYKDSVKKLEICKSVMTNSSIDTTDMNPVSVNESNSSTNSSLEKNVAPATESASDEPILVTDAYIGDVYSDWFYIKVKVKNNTEETITFNSVWFELLDSNGDILGTTASWDGVKLASGQSLIVKSDSIDKDSNLSQIACYSYTYNDASGTYIEGLFEDVYLVDVKSELTAPTPLPTEKPSSTPMSSPMPTAQPTPTPMPTAQPTPTPMPTAQPTRAPMPTVQPTRAPASTPKPTIKPTNKPNTSSSSSYVAKGHEMDAWVCAQDIVEANLKSPSSAKFCKYPDATITYCGDADYMVVGWVDAENSYGAKIRTSFIVTLTLTEKGYKNGYVIFDE